MGSRLALLVPAGALMRRRHRVGFHERFVAKITRPDGGLARGGGNGRRPPPPPGARQRRRDSARRRLPLRLLRLFLRFLLFYV